MDREILKVYLLADTKKSALMAKSDKLGATIDLPAQAPDAIASVVVVEY